MANDNTPPAGKRPEGRQAAGSAESGRAPPSQGLRNLVTLGVVVLGVALLYWLVTLFIDWNKMQTCLSYGGHNCTPTMQLNDH